LLKQFRKRKRLNQKQLAERIEASREAVSLWERGEYKPEADRILYKMVDVLALTAQEQQQLFEAYTVTARTVSFHNPPLTRNPYFTGRGPQLTDLHRLLMAGKQVALTQVITGLGGIGKTQLALEYAYRYQKSYHDIFWAVADTEESLMTSYVRIAGFLDLPEYDEPDQSKAKAAVQYWLNKHKGWLLILDNIEDLSLVDQFIPRDRQGAVLLTTRRHVTEPVAQALELELLPENDAILFLLKRTTVLAVNMSLGDASDHDIMAAKAITQLLGNLPLALDQAGAYILETQCSFADYLTLFKTHQNQLLQRRIGERIPTDHPESVTTTFDLNFQQVQQRSKVAGELLRVCAFLASDGIGEEIFVNGASSLGTILQPLKSDGFLLNQAIEVLCTFSLIRRDSMKKTISIHRLVQAVFQKTLEETERRSWAERAALAVNEAFPENEHETWPQCERLLPHALAVAQWSETYQFRQADVGRLLYETASYLRDRARYAEAEPLYQRALRIREQQLGPDHLLVAKSLNGLASLYSNQGNYAEAEPLYQRALHSLEQQLGLDHPEVAKSLNNLASLYREQSKYAEAEPLYQRALSIWEQLGPDYAGVAYPLNGLATLYYDQGKYAEAEPLFQRTLRIWEQQLGPDHPLVAYPLNNLANLYQEQSKYAEAEPLYQRALRIREQQLGPDHSDVAASLNGLATFYQEQSKYAEAEPLYQRALRIWEQQLRPDHPLVAYPLNGLATLYQEQGKYAEAEPLFQRTLRIWEQQLGPDHPLVAYPLNGLATLYQEQGKYAEAEPLYQRALSIREQQLGPDHLETAEIIHDLARFREAQGNSEEARASYARALTIRKQALGAQHPKTTETRTRLIALLHAMGHHEEAAQLETIRTEQGMGEEKRETHPEE